MNATPSSPIVTIDFGNLDTFCEELAARGPNIKPVVRMCQQIRQGQSDALGPLPIEDVFAHVSYLRRCSDVLQVVALHLYLGQRWRYADETPDRTEVKRRVDQVYERVRATCETLGLALADGSTYQPRSAQG